MFIKSLAFSPPKYMALAQIISRNVSIIRIVEIWGSRVRVSVSGYNTHHLRAYKS